VPVQLATPVQLSGLQFNHSRRQTVTALFQAVTITFLEYLLKPE